tara:strand:- start:548 stop:838 length:291 start_codon:yes stop_codon:yes gene_type:complete
MTKNVNNLNINIINKIDNYKYIYICEKCRNLLGKWCSIKQDLITWSDIKIEKCYCDNINDFDNFDNFDNFDEKSDLKLYDKNWDKIYNKVIYKKNN